MSVEPKKPEEKVDLLKVLDKAAKSAFRGGAAGAAAMGINVFALMWMRTTINYQYRYGMSMFSALRTLYADGGILRFYRGVGFALVQGPWSRFGDTAANTGALDLMNAFETTRDMNASVKTLGASAAAAVFRMASTPIDTCKTIMQVEGRSGLTKLYQKYASHGGFPRGLPQLWHGAYGTVGATFVGHYPWFATYNAMQEAMPKSGYVAALALPVDQKHHALIDKLIKNATIGFCASAISDTCSNSIRVVKASAASHVLRRGGRPYLRRRAPCRPEAPFAKPRSCHRAECSAAHQVPDLVPREPDGFPPLTRAAPPHALPWLGQVYKQTHSENMGYLTALRNVLKDGGVTGLMFRGLGTKVHTHAPTLPLQRATWHCAGRATRAWCGA